MPEIIHEYDDRGRHRLNIDGSRGEWAMYEHVAEHKGYMAFTDYYDERVVEFKVLNPVKTDQVCSECGRSTGWNGQTLPVTTCEHQKKKYPTLMEDYVEPPKKEVKDA